MDTDELKNKIIIELKRVDGAEIHVKSLAHMTGTSLSACRHVAENLVNSGAIRKVQTSRCTAFYYIPTLSMLSAELSQAMRIKPFTPLKPRTDKAAIIERIRQERAAIPSIY